MTLTHRIIAQILDEREEDDPLLDAVHDADIRVRTLVDLHFLETLEELLGFLIHLTRVGVVPFRRKEAVKLALALGDVVPKSLHVGDKDLDVLDVLHSLSNELRLAKLRRVVTVVGDELLKLCEFTKDTIKLRLGCLGTASVLEELSLPHITSELRDILFELLDEANIAVRLIGYVRIDFLLGILGDLLHVGPLLLKLVERFELSILFADLSLEELEGLFELVNLKSSAVNIRLGLLDVFLNLE